jgi:hypothetical protein
MSTVELQRDRTIQEQFALALAPSGDETTVFTPSLDCFSLALEFPPAAESKP